MILRTALLAISLHTAWAGPRIVNLRGRPEYKKVSLSWGVDSGGQAPSGLFRLRFCENQIWGEHYCQERLLEDSQNKQNFSTDIYGTDDSHDISSHVFSKQSRSITCHRCNGVLTAHHISIPNFLQPEI